MKKVSLIFLLFSLMSIDGFAQLKNEMILSYGYANNDIIMNEDIIGDMGFAGRKTFLLEAGYQRKLNNSFSFESGFAYSKSEIVYNYFPSGVLNTKKLEINLMSFPIGVNFNFLKYFYINAGTIIDFELGRPSDQVTYDQSGFGFYGGVGAKYSIRNFTVKINPFIIEHSSIPFEKEKYNQRLLEKGVRIGVGFNF